MGRAIAFSDLGEVETIEVENEPVQPDDVAGETLVTLISPGTELAYYTSSELRRRASSQRGLARFIPGYAAVFRIEEIGSAVERFEAGQVVYCMGAHRSFQCHPANKVLPFPDGLDPADATFARIAGVSMTSLVTTDVRPPGPVAVLGLGLVGNLAAQVFNIAGYKVSAADPIDSRVEVARVCGIDAHTDIAASELLIPRLVLECSGNEDAALRACEVVQLGGEVVLVGVPWRQRSAISAHKLLDKVYSGLLRLRSGSEWQLPLDDRPLSRGNILENHALALSWLNEKKLRVEALAEPIRPDQAQLAYESLLRGEGALTRLIRWRD
jgi:threonine dehydrogenase-like Zn-dependent dehydrogenase